MKSGFLPEIEPEGKHLHCIALHFVLSCLDRISSSRVHVHVHVGRQSSLLVVFLLLCDEMSSRGSRLLIAYMQALIISHVSFSFSFNLSSFLSSLGIVRCSKVGRYLQLHVLFVVPWKSSSFSSRDAVRHHRGCS